MSTDLSHENFNNHLNTRFQVDGNGEHVELLLIEVSELRQSKGQEQFSIVFRGPIDQPMAQGMRQFRHSEMGGFELFIVPIKQDGEGYQYEAVFNRLKETLTTA